MGLFSFIAEAGKKIFGHEQKEAESGQPVQQLNDQQLQALRQHVEGLGLNIQNLGVRLDGPGAITLTGVAASKAEYEKAGLVAGNVMGITTVNNQITIAAPAAATAPAEEPDAETYTIVKGDTLWAIAEKHYGSGAKYPEIVKANQPMIKDADEIYPGQVLRLPKLS